MHPANMRARGKRVWLFYGQPYGGAPYGRFSDRSFFFYFSKFLSFSDLKKNFQEKFFEKKKDRKFYRGKFEKKI